MHSVFIAGPYGTGEDVGENMFVAMESWHELQRLGFAPFCPHLNHFLHMHQPRPLGVWIEWDNHWLGRCDCLYRLPGESVGAEAEERRAVTLGIPVFHAIDDLVVYWEAQSQ